MEEKNKESLIYDPDDILGVAIDLAEQMLMCGAEIHRVEDTIEHICAAYGATDIEVFTIPSLITAEIKSENGKHSTMVRRVYSSSNDLSMLELLNALSREICETKIEPGSARKKINAIKGHKTYPIIIRYLGAILATASFTVFFGGTFFDALPTAIVALFMTLYDFNKPKIFNQIMNTACLSFIGGTLSILLISIGIGDNLDKVMIGTIMFLIPGLALGNAMRDMLCGDIISGVVRMIQAILIAAAIALGYFVAILIFGGLLQ